jgi:hypothetical protein
MATHERNSPEFCVKASVSLELCAQRKSRNECRADCVPFEFGRLFDCPHQGFQKSETDQ